MNTARAWSLSALISVLYVVGTVPAARGQDALDEALGLVGLRRADLGWRPPGWWLGYPGDIPYKLRHFDDLMAQPLAAVSYTQTLAAAVRSQLDPEKVNGVADRFGAGALFHAVYSVGVAPKFGGIRGYSPNTIAAATPLDEAILTVHRMAGRPTEFVTFGTTSPYPQFKEELAEKLKAVPADVQPILGRLVLNVAEAQRWAELAFRNVPGQWRIAASRKVNVGEEQVDALDYEPAFDDVARTWDEASLWYAGLKCVQALDETRLSLRTLEGEFPPFAFDWETPHGWIRFRGSGADVVDATDAWLIVDLGGDDRYTGPAGASAVDRPIGLLLDLEGDDEYAGEGPAQGAGVCGVGVLLDAAGNDSYQAGRLAQGLGQFGLGACIDLAGDDRYDVHYSGQGCGYFGIGVLLDGGGADTYRLYCDGQGLGGVAGVGVLADYSGDDAYEAVRDSNVTGRPSYHSPDEHISVSNAQGCAMGRRGDGADGHSWAGGLGALIDISGNDRYLAGNWSMGTGYWFGAGLLYDGSGDDHYQGVVWTQATGAHFCIGVLVDEGGNDRHVAEATSNNSIAFGHDFAVALLINRGGDDAYSVGSSGLGQSINRSVAMLIDTDGADTYTIKPAGEPDTAATTKNLSQLGSWYGLPARVFAGKTAVPNPTGIGSKPDSDVRRGPGTAVFDEKLRDRTGRTTYFADSTSLGLFLDIGGEDAYHCDPEMSNNTTRFDPPDSDNAQVRNFGVAVDRESGEVNLTPLPERAVKSR